jgi:hypothetical protein
MQTRNADADTRLCMVQQHAYEATFLVNSTSIATAKMLEVNSYVL